MLTIRSETKWRQKYYAEVEKATRQYEFINRSAEMRVRKITKEEIEEYNKEQPKTFMLKSPNEKIGRRN